MKTIARLVLTLASVLLWWACDEVPRGREGASEREWSRPHALQAVAAGGQWSTTGSMTTARSAHTATLLPSGKVLVSGGTSSASAELYDPLTGKWSTTGGMTTARSNHTATLLPSGQVLVSGGTGSSGALASAELYDPLTGKWSTTGNLATARSNHTATLLTSGQVLVSGGGGSSAELYDPLTGKWSPTGGMATARSKHTATLLPSGQVLVSGGSSSSGDSSASLASAELYEPLTGAWSPLEAMTTARSVHTATLLPSGQVLVTGGSNSSGTLASTELYDPGTGKWSVTGNLATARFSHMATLLPSGQVLVSAGNNLGSLLGSAEVYDPDTGEWSSAGGMATARSWPTATLLPSGQVLVTGGLGSFSAIAQAVVYDPGPGTWSTTGTMDTALVAHAATLLPSGQVLVSGGRSFSSGSPFTRALVYDPGTEKWNPTGDMASARSGHTVTLLPSGKVLVTGGLDASGPLASAEVYDPLTGKWSPTSGMASARSGHTVTLLPSGKVLVTGGLDASGPLASAEVYDPATGTWSFTGGLTTARYSHTATLLTSGKVLVASGYGGGPLASAEVYDPATGTWSFTGDLATARYSHTATLLPSGKVLVTGGVGVNSSTGRMEMRGSAEVYDPGSGAWSAAGTLATARCRHEATLLTSGKVLVTGGYTNPGLYLYTATAEVYDPLTGTWSPTGDLSISRPEHTATLLPSGQVLVTGDWRSGYIFASVEVYEDPAVRPEGRPLIDPSAGLHPGEDFLIKGRHLRGRSEASSGDSRNSATNLPLIRLFPVEGGAPSRAVPMDRLSDTEVSVRTPRVPSGYYILSVMTNAIHGGRLVHVDGSLSAPELDSPGAFVNTRKPAIGGTATPGATVRVWLDGSPVGTAPADARGQWSFTPDTVLAEGLHQAWARATDEVGNVSPDSAKRDFEVDTLPPGAPVMNNLEDFINDPMPVFAGRAEPGSTVTVWLDHDGTEMVAGTAVAEARGDWSLLPSTALREGLHRARATATDKAGNVSPDSGSHFFTVDTQAPAAPVVTAPDKPFINTTRPVMGGAAEAGSTVTVGWGEDVVETAVADAAGTWTLTPGTALREGLHRVWAKATDPAGNVSPVSAEYSFTVDTQPPEAPVVTAPGDRADTQTPIIAGTVEPGMTVKVWLDDDAANAGPVFVSEVGSWRFTPSTALEFGYHSVSAIAVDAAGNASAPSQHRFVIQRSHYGWSCTTTPTAPATWALLALLWSLGRRRPRSPARNGG
ncbi:galactose oxidase-like protein [Archangium gephyra]|nr:kelch repeat-containing protein [Archangium gephyra]REG20478.1 galactose oxidase-like protein [Archangium gephyra]